MNVRVNCKYWDGYTSCTHPERKGLINFRNPFNYKKIIKIGKRQCLELGIGKNCKLAERYPRPATRPGAMSV